MGTCNFKVSGNPKDVVTFFDKLNCIGLDSRVTPLEEEGEGYLSCPCEEKFINILCNPFSSEDENNIVELSTALGCIVEIWACVERPYPLSSFYGVPVCTEFSQHHILIVCGRFVNAGTHGKRKYDLKPFQKVARTDSEAVVLLNDLCSKDFTMHILLI